MQLKSVSSSSMLSGIMYMLLAMFALATMDALAKHLVQDRFDPIQILAMRGWIILLLMLVFYASRSKLRKLKPVKPMHQLARGVFGFLAPYCFFKSLQVLPLADATVIFFSSTFMITALSGPFLKEKVGIYRWSAVIMGFIGVIIAMDPQGGGEIESYLYCLAGSFSYAVLFISGRWLSRTESVDSLVFGFNFCLTLAATALAPSIWVSVAISDLWAIALFSMLALVGHFFITHAFSQSDAAVIAPLEYTALIWAVLWGYLVWGDIPNQQVIIGALIIIGCALLVIFREAKIANFKG